MGLLLQLTVNGMVNGAVFALLACAFGLVYRSLRVFHIAFAGLILVAPYGAYAASMGLELPIGVAVVLGVLACALAGLGLEWGMYRPFFVRKASAGTVMVASLGAFIVLENALALGFGNEIHMFDRVLAARIALGPVAITSIQALQFGISAAMLLGLGWAIRSMPTFKAVWAMGDEPELIPVLGLPLMRYRAVVFALSSALGGVATCLLALDLGVDPHMGMSYLLIAAVAVLAGGIDRFWAWMLGGLILSMLQSLMVWSLSPRWMDLVTFSVLIAMLFFRPQGLFGVRKRLEEE